MRILGIPPLSIQQTPEDLEAPAAARAAWLSGSSVGNGRGRRNGRGAQERKKRPLGYINRGASLLLQRDQYSVRLAISRCTSGARVTNRALKPPTRTIRCPYFSGWSIACSSSSLLTTVIIAWAPPLSK